MYFASFAVLAQEKPNIVVIMTDNQGYGDLGSFGGTRAEVNKRIARIFYQL